MEVHVELRGEITVDNRVYVLQVVPSRVLVQRVRRRVGPVPAAPATSGCHRGRSSRENRRGALGAPHQLRHQRIAVPHYNYLSVNKQLSFVSLYF